MIKKLITFWSFIVASTIVILAFITATSYFQLMVAIVLYPFLIYITYRFFLVNHVVVYAPPIANVKTATPLEGNAIASVSDADRRMFLKLIGSTGLFLLIYTFINKKTGGLLPRNIDAQDAHSLGLKERTDIDTSSDQLIEGFKISEVEDDIVSYYGFINQEGAWYIMKADTSKGTFRYSRGSSDFPGNWGNREKLSYDYLNNVF